MGRLRRFLPPFTPVSFARVTFLLDYHLDSVIPEHSQYYCTHGSLHSVSIYYSQSHTIGRPNNTPTNIANLID